MTGDVKISIQNRIDGAHHLAESRLWEIPGFNPWIPKARRVRRYAGFPVYLPDAAFEPRRAKP